MRAARALLPERAIALDVETCFQTHRARVYRWAHALCRRHEDALDVVQDVFLRLIDRRPALASAAAEVTWLRRVTQRVVIDRWRAESARAVRQARHVPVVTIADPLETRELVDQLRGVLGSLSEQQRLVIMCKCFDQMTFQQIADELGIAVPTAKTHYLRALAAVRARLKADIKAGRVP
jgi:RNA polymerase sigma-70 factor (ECF subfamily)